MWEGKDEDMIEHLDTILTVCGAAITLVAVLVIFIFLTNVLDESTKEEDDERD